MSTFLPGYIAARPKQGFCPPVAEWAAGLLRERILPESVLFDEGLVDAARGESPLREGSCNSSFALWTLGTLMAWCETNL